MKAPQPLVTLHRQPDPVLQALLEARGRHVSGSCLAGLCGLSRSSVWRRIGVLRGLGFGIGAHIGRGYRLDRVPDMLLPDLIGHGLETRCVGQCVAYYKTIDSTNRAARAYAQAGVPDGTLVVAEKQTRGRGRMNRAWIAPACKNILCSLVLHPPVPPSSAFRLTMLASVAVAAAIGQICGVKAEIKWPNDVYCCNRKVCGILTEFAVWRDVLNYVVVGIGLNVNMDTARVRAISDSAISLSEIRGGRVSRVDVLKGILKEIDRRYCQLRSAGGRELQREWEQRSMITNRRVDVICGDETIRGIARGISKDGHLILHDESGSRRLIMCGDVSLRVGG